MEQEEQAEQAQGAEMVRVRVMLVDELSDVEEVEQKPRSKQPKRKELYTPAEVADELGLTRRTVYSWISSGRIPAGKIGPKMWAVRAHTVEALKDGRDPWRAENGFQGSLVKKQAREIEKLRLLVEKLQIREYELSNGAAALSAELLAELEADAAADAAAMAARRGRSSSTAGKTDFFGRLSGAAGSGGLGNAPASYAGAAGPSGVLAPMKSAAVGGGAKPKPGKGRRR